ncbi:hypothetical protein Syun_002754 [Stephania yunnanensis]|uniref:Uncharacterized protein n=1 Tax=Stephania yunnanensis TaxID=152371 RepID=A0AAP0LM36_9MAGN
MESQVQVVEGIRFDNQIAFNVCSSSMAVKTYYILIDEWKSRKIRQILRLGCHNGKAESGL